MMVRVKKEEQDMMVDADTDLSRACDAVLEARQSVSEAKKILDAADETLIGIMQDVGKKSVKHEGHRFILSHQDASDKIQIKSE